MLASRPVPHAVRPLFLTPRAELRRLDAHFRRVLARLHRSPPAGLGPAQRRARARHLEELERYRRRGRFPKNRTFPGLLVPHFIDADGTRCAMGHLIEQAGGADLVHYIARTRNYDRVHDLADIPELLRWLEENGLTADEAALVQPSYCESASDCLCYYDAMAMLEGDFVAGGTDSILVTAVHGDGGGILAGDTVDVFNNAGAMDGAHVLALHDPGVTVVEWLVDASEQVTVTSCSFVAMPPGPLPKQTLINAVLAADATTCKDVLEAHDPAWNELQGDCNVETGSGGATSTSAAVGAGAGSGTGAGAGSGSGSGGAGGGDDGGCAMGSGAAPGGALVLALLAGACVLRGGRRVLRR